MSTTADNILNTAEECFFRHGYGATNIAMISRQSKISRVTIHKHFGSKEKLFRAVMTRHLNEVQSKFPHYLSDYEDTWSAIEHMLLDCGRPLFETITDQWVLQELVQASSEHCEDIKVAHMDSVEEITQRLLQKGVDAGAIDMARVGLTPKEFAQTLSLITKGLFTTAPLEEIQRQLTRVVMLFKSAVSPLSS